MTYTVQKLAELAGVSKRTLRYYDQIGLLHPAEINASGYRIYTEKEVDLLQQILFFRELDVDLDTIKSIIYSADFDRKKALEEHRDRLLDKQEHIRMLLGNVEKSIQAMERKVEMTDNEKFIGFKEEKIAENEANYGEEIREAYGKEAVEAANQKFRGLSEEQYRKMEAVEQRLFEKLKRAMQGGDPTSPGAMQTAELHREWLSFNWSAYSKEAHAGLAEMYVHDERFTAYYDNKIGEGAAQFLRDSIRHYTMQ
ncbi:MerR family transcriptional regulator [Terribacillus saccharophilus]|uniref:MerR family transcriptional regulator n=1 Tax=Terribacillus saccharophilus TaxID=361277 RepID=UPI002989F30D|nr:MerR family transcriptional regulator [Terribacillus saccharophilus]MEC0283969.1 MerR family transcriptional regulator [Terribacillus saccharophilus]MEC0289862.1 MerR family transcriptional regulator [Terribacillus saccharophilus]